MDLTKEYPRSVHDKWQGVVQLARTIDKGKAKARGNVGEYHFNCPMDQAVFGFLGIDHEQLLDSNSQRQERRGDRSVHATIRRCQVARRDRALESRVVILRAARRVSEGLSEPPRTDRSRPKRRDDMARPPRHRREAPRSAPRRKCVLTR